MARQYVIAVVAGPVRSYLGHLGDRVDRPEFARKFSLPADAWEYRREWVRLFAADLSRIAPEWDVAVEEFGSAETYGTAPPEVTP